MLKYFKRIVILGTFCLFFASLTIAQVTFEYLENFPEGGGAFPQDVSADGSTIVGYANHYTVFLPEACIWTEQTGLIGLGFLPGGNTSAAYAVSADGSVIVGYSTNALGRQEAFRWTAGTGMVGLGGLPGVFNSAAYGVSSNGSVIVGRSTTAANVTEAFRWTQAGGMVGLGDLPGGPSSFSFAEGVSGDGSVIVGYGYSENGQEAFRWTSGTGMIGLGDLPGGDFGSQAKGISSAGNTIVGGSEVLNFEQAFISNGTEITGLDFMPGGFGSSQALDVSSDGSVIVGRGESGLTVGSAFVWTTTTGMIDLQWLLLTGYGIDAYVTTATAISDNGTVIVGGNGGPGWRAVFPDGFQLPFVELTSPQANELWIAGEQDTIKWSDGNTGQFLNIEFSTDNGNNFSQIAIGISADSGHYIWSIPQNILSTKVKIKISNVADLTVFDVSDTFKIKGYELTRFTANGDYERFRPEIHGWNFENRSDNVWPESYWQQIDYINGIDPYTNSNYPDMFNSPPVNANPNSSDYTDWISFVRAFGTDQCYYDLTLPVYKPSAVMLWAFTKVGFLGACFGFAVSSIAAFDHPQEFIDYFGFAPFSNLYSVNLDEMSRNTINESYDFQWGKAQKINYFENHNKTPNEVLEELKNIFKNESTDNTCLRYYEDGIDNFGNGGFSFCGHVVVPYKIKKDSNNPDNEYIYIYDNNYPGDTTRRITILKSLNGWEDLVDGWDGTDNLFLSNPSSEFLTIPELQLIVLPFRNMHKVYVNSVQPQTIYNSPFASISIHNTSGDSIGFNKKIVFNTMSDANPIIPEIGHPHPPIGYNLGNDNYKLNIHSINNSNCYAAMITDSVIMMYSRDDADSTQTDELSFGDGLVYESKDNGQKSVNFRTLIMDQNSQKIFDVLNCNINKDDLLQLKTDNNDGLKIINSGTFKTYNLNLEMASANGNPKNSFEQIHLPLNSMHRISPDWNDLSKPLIIFEDVGNDGTINDTLIVNDNSNPPIPVELISFSASLEKEGISLKWKTVTEINNNGFEIERTSTPLGMNWEKIGFVKGAGSTVERSDYSYLDKTAPSANLKYRLKQIDYNGSFVYSNVAEIDNVTKLNYDLAQNYPNPFNPVTTIKYTIPENTKVQVVVYDVIGQTVAVLVNENQEKGIHKLNFDGSNLNSGIYFYQLVADNNIITRKMTLIK